MFQEERRLREEQERKLREDVSNIFYHIVPVLHYGGGVGGGGGSWRGAESKNYLDRKVYFALYGGAGQFWVDVFKI